MIGETGSRDLLDMLELQNGSDPSSTQTKINTKKFVQVL
ncbi:hypothetical protein SK3146_01378 [Paenibacillus konkukensis]|uniref:Uncharacterized protein n=1 Tax=Paenibacillus konkukensis TaxID=2020716 RepID=A0ABY4RIH0_9BACL|nr:hypothetical protein SK3146_01378 [Paenibacillus konkukensis]